MIGQTLKHYEVLEVLGQGGMGVVYRARDLRLDRAVALKVLPEHLTQDPERRRRFLTEARAACAVSHSAIAQVFDVDQADGAIFIVMELVEGRTVRKLVASGELDVLGAVEIAMQVAQGLARAHEARIVHRDIKADNIMVTRDGHAKILDFGLAKLLDPPGGAGAAGAPSASVLDTRTQAGMVLGTLGYMSPEQARGQPADHRADIFSLGVVLYEMVTGQPPFAGSSPVDTLHAIAYQEIRPITTIRANLPGSLDRVIARCLRKKPEERYPSAHELAVDLKRVQREVETGISQALPLGERLREGMRSLRERTPGEWVLPLSIAALLVLLVAWIVTRSGEDGVGPPLAFFAVVGLLVWRRMRNRGRRMIRRFATKLAKMPEVRLVALDGVRATVVVDHALARTYVRVNALIDAANRKQFFGEPYSVVVRDDLTESDILALLRGPGVIYVRPDVVSGRQVARS